MPHRPPPVSGPRPAARTNQTIFGHSHSDRVRTTNLGRNVSHTQTRPFKLASTTTHTNQWQPTVFNDQYASGPPKNLSLNGRVALFIAGIILTVAGIALVILGSILHIDTLKGLGGFGIAAGGIMAISATCKS